MCEEDKRGQIRWRSKGLVFTDNVAVAPARLHITVLLQRVLMTAQSAS